MTGPNNDQLIQYQNKIKRLAQSCSSKLHLTEETDMDDWSQETVEKYYDYCLQRRVIPTIDIQNSTLHLIGPKDAYWDLSDVNFNRVVLLESSKEYIDVWNRFDSTMNNNYSKIIKIERIQNECWYKQYAAHRDEYTQSDERLLFHGCCSISADKIVQECFNRAFAGLHARVLIGKTCIGKSLMKVPPEGFDTTTDGRHIFVIYHDAGAYGEYLITYK
ncbi:unnamed protein product [Rotaria sp. Silwood1]|nr:unnamed protein product [Rotaria sp. Silwood1]